MAQILDVYDAEISSYVADDDLVIWVVLIRADAIVRISEQENLKVLFDAYVSFIDQHINDKIARDIVLEASY